jgi:hypothetical protein
MWIFTLDGFYSVVEDWSNKNFVYARSRNAGDIDRLIRRLNSGAKRKNTPERDYPFRVRLRKKAWRRYVNRAVTDLRYTNFKSAVHDKNKDGWERAMTMTRIWSAIMDAFRPRREPRTVYGGSWYERDGVFSDEDGQEVFRERHSTFG